ncbi:MAG: UDP-N-acetylmuramoyl-L-alanine--D-glutamate ligase [Thermodesulfobacteriota bacterium]|nr:UDP-N-acetylmuramoyl-L-alanine--D-glutamate ligase [Thermodesulfobacteriota bacterium]
MELFKKKVLVIGLGKSGLAAAGWLSGKGAVVTVSDIKTKAELDQELLNRSIELGIKLETGPHRKETFLASDMIVISPGVPLDIEPLKAARKKGIPLMGEMELAGRLIDTPIVAVTGTNGKSTATVLLGAIIARAGLSVFVGGNIGTPLMDYAAGDCEADYAVTEVSSFQLDTMEKFCPLVSLILNISPDHLERYPDYETYTQSKLKIFQNQGPDQYLILNDDDEKLSRLEPSGGVSVLRYGAEKRENRHAFLEDGKLKAYLPGTEVKSFNPDKFGPPGRHNLENLMGVVLAGLSLDIGPDIIQESIDHFKGLPHRLEFVGSIRGVDFYDDSKATNVDAASRSLTGFERPVIIIAGGRHKGGDYLPLVRAATGRVRKGIFLGEAKHLLAQSFSGIIPFSIAENMEDAVSKAFSSAITNDVVLLAPACSSFDMFSDYAHRGRIFQEAVERLNSGN